MRVRSATVIGLLAALLAFGALEVQAQPREEVNKTVETASPQEVADGMASKAARGLANIATGWMEIPKQIRLTIKEDGLSRGLTVGPLKGLGMFVVRTVAGAAETATFFVAVPGFYDPYMEPALVWEKE